MLFLLPRHQMYIAPTYNRLNYDHSVNRYGYGYGYDDYDYDFEFDAMVCDKHHVCFRPMRPADWSKLIFHNVFIHSFHKRFIIQYYCYRRKI